jgi:hypothetical protein
LWSSRSPCCDGRKSFRSMSSHLCSSSSRKVSGLTPTAEFALATPKSPIDRVYFPTTPHLCAQHLDQRLARTLGGLEGMMKSLPWPRDWTIGIALLLQSRRCFAVMMLLEFLDVSSALSVTKCYCFKYHCGCWCVSKTGIRWAVQNALTIAWWPHVSVHSAAHRSGRPS